MISLPITATIASLLALLILPLTMLISFGRINLGKAQGDIAKFPFGDIDDEKFRRRRSALQNFCEYTPLAIIMLALLEITNGSSNMVWALGGLFVFGRAIHAVALLTIPKNPLPRIIAMFITYAIFLIPALIILYNTVFV